MERKLYKKQIIDNIGETIIMPDMALSITNPKENKLVIVEFDFDAVSTNKIKYIYYIDFSYLCGIIGFDVTKITDSKGDELKFICNNTNDYISIDIIEGEKRMYVEVKVRKWDIIDRIITNPYNLIHDSVFIKDTINGSYYALSYRPDDKKYDILVPIRNIGTLAIEVDISVNYESYTLDIIASNARLCSENFIRIINSELLTDDYLHYKLIIDM